MTLTMHEKIASALDILTEVDAHSLGHSEYKGGWWELACNGCDVFKGKRYSHLDQERRHAAHREDVFKRTLAAWLFDIELENNS